jgi:hypothetical protein
MYEVPPLNMAPADHSCLMSKVCVNLVHSNRLWVDIPLRVLMLCSCISLLCSPLHLADPIQGVILNFQGFTVSEY